MSHALRHACAGLGLAALSALPALAQSGPKLTTNLFGDLRYVAQDTTRVAGQPAGRSRAQLGQLDFMAQGSLDDHWSAFAEAVLEYNDATRTTGVDLERFYVEYQANDAFTAGLGKRHTPLGYWNNAFHHGAVFQPTIDRPLLVQFEDGGGLQPAHDTGLWVRGRLGHGGWFGYDLMSSNGQTGSQVGDANSHKAVTGHVEARLGPGAVGFSYRSDLLSANMPLNAREGSVPLDTDLTFAGVDVRIDHERFRLLSEFMQVKEKADALGATPGWNATHNGWFVYVGVPVEDWTPYLLVQGLRIESESRVYAGLAESQRSQTLGLKYQFDTLVNLKAEVKRVQLTDSNRTERQITLAVAFGF